MTTSYDIDHEAEHWKRVGPELLEACKRLCEFGNRMLSTMGAAGHRQTDSGEWICDPWTQAFKDARAAIAKATRD